MRKLGMACVILSLARAGFSDVLPGEDFASAIPITGLPHASSGSSCGYRDDYEAPCRGVFDAPDVVYVFTAEADTCLSVGLCDSNFNTVLHVYDGSLAGLVGCNDNWCATQSLIPELRALAGHTYYIVIDGSAGECGDYHLEIATCSPCRLECPPGAVQENEPNCFAGYVDRYNGGCSTDPPTFLELPCSDTLLTVCGTYGNDFNYDQDLYRLSLPEAGRLRVCIQAEGSPQLVILGAACNVILCDDGADRCETLCCDNQFAAGIYHILVRPALTKQVVPCGSQYRLEILGNACPMRLHAGSWGIVKSVYR